MNDSDKIQAYLGGLDPRDPSQGAGHDRTEDFADGRCYDCGRRGHKHFDCPGIVAEVEEPRTHRVIYYSKAFKSDLRMGPMGITRATRWAETLQGRVEEVR